MSKKNIKIYYSKFSGIQELTLWHKHNMKTLFFRVLLIGIFSTSSLFGATSAPEWLTVVESSGTTISLDWNDTDEAVWYYVYYGTQSPEDGNYEVQWVDLIESSDFIIDNIAPQTQYFITLTAVDEFGAESAYAEELTYTTKEAWSAVGAANLRIKEVIVVDTTSLEFIFSTALDSSPSAVERFIIEDIVENKELAIALSQVSWNDPQKLIVVLQDELAPEREYKVTILDIKDSDGNSIEAGIDGFISFTSPKSLIDEEVNLSAAPEQVGVEEESKDDILVDETHQNDKPVINTSTQDTTDTQDTPVNSWDNAGVKLTKEELWSTTIQTATQADKLPQTGPEHWLLLILTVLITGGLYLFFYTQTVWKK